MPSTCVAYIRSETEKAVISIEVMKFWLNATWRVLKPSKWKANSGDQDIFLVWVTADFQNNISLTSRSIGRPLLHYEDKLEDNLKQCSIPFSSWEKQSISAKELFCSCFSSIQRFAQSWLGHWDQLRANIKASRQHAAPLYDSLLPATVALSHAVKQALLSTRGNMWQLILNHSSKMDQPYVPSLENACRSQETRVSIEVEHTLFYWALIVCKKSPIYIHEPLL